MKIKSKDQPKRSGSAKVRSQKITTTAKGTAQVFQIRRSTSARLTAQLEASVSDMWRRWSEIWLLKRKVDELYTWHAYVHGILLELEKAATATPPGPILTARIQGLLLDLRPVPSLANPDSHFVDVSPTITASRKLYKSANELFLLLFEFTEKSKWTGKAKRRPGVHPLEGVDRLILDYVGFALRCQTAELNDAEECMSLKVGESWTGLPSKTHLKLIDLVGVVFPDEPFDLRGLDVFLDGDVEAVLDFV